MSAESDARDGYSDCAFDILEWSIDQLGTLDARTLNALVLKINALMESNETGRNWRTAGDVAERILARIPNPAQPEGERRGHNGDAINQERRRDDAVLKDVPPVIEAAVGAPALAAQGDRS